MRDHGFGSGVVVAFSVWRGKVDMFGVVYGLAQGEELLFTGFMSERHGNLFLSQSPIGRKIY